MAQNVVEVVVRATNLTKPGFAEAKAGAEETAAGMDTLAEAEARVTDASIRYAQAQGGLLDAQLKLMDVEGKEGVTEAEIAAARDKVTAATVRQADASIALLNAEARQEAAAGASVAASDRTAVAAKGAADAQRAQGDAALASGAKNEEAGGLMAGMGSKLKLAGIGVAVGMGLAVKAAADYQNSTVHLVTDAGESAKSLGMVQQGMLAISAATGTAASDVSNGMYHVESAGFHGAQGLAVLKVAAEGAKVGGADLDTVSKSLTGTMNAYGMSSKDAGEQTRMSVSLMNQLIAAVGAGDMKMEDLASSLGNVAPVAATAKISFAQVGGALATMTAQNMSAQQATQDLRHTIVSLQNPNAVQRKELAALGLSAHDLQQNLGKRGLSGTLELVADAARKHAGALGQTYVQAVAKATGGTTGMNTALMLTGTHLETFKGNIATVGAAADKSGTSVDNWGKIQGTLSFKTDQAKASLQAMGISLGTALLPAVTAVLGPMAHMLSVIAGNKTASIALAVVVGGLLAGAIGGKMAKALKDMAEGIKTAGEGAGWLIGKLTGLAGASDATAATQEADAAEVAVANDEAAAESSGSWATAAGQQIASAARWVAQTAVKIATVTAQYAVAAASSAAKWAVSAGQMIAQAAVWVAQNVAKIAIVVGANIAGALTTAGAWMAANAVMLLGIGLVVALVAVAVVEIVKHWKQISHAAEVAFHFVLSVVGHVIGWIKSHWPLLLAILLGPIALAALMIGTHWRQITHGASVMFHDIVSFFRSLPSRILHALGDLGSLLFNSGKKIVEGLLNGIKNMAGSVGNVIGGVVDDIKSFLPFSPAKKGPLSGAGAPENSGRSIMRLLAQGITSGSDAPQQAMRQIAQKLAGASGLSGGSGGYGAYGGGQGQLELVLRFEKTGNALVDGAMETLRGEVRKIGGDPMMFQRKVAFRT